MKPGIHQYKTDGLLVGFLLVIALLLAQAGIGIAYLHAMSRTITTIVEEHNEQFRLASEMYIAARERALRLHAILQETDAFERDALVPPFYELAGRFRGARQKLLSMRLAAGERALLEEQGKYTNLGSALQDDVLSLALADRREDAERLLATQAIPLQNQATVRLRRFLDQQIVDSRTSVEDSKRQYRLALVLMGAELKARETVRASGANTGSLSS